MASAIRSEPSLVSSVRVPVLFATYLHQQSTKVLPWDTFRGRGLPWSDLWQNRPVKQKLKSRLAVTGLQAVASVICLYECSL